MSAIHDAARTVEQAAAAEQSHLDALLAEQAKLTADIVTVERTLADMRGRLDDAGDQIRAQRRTVEQADKLAQAVFHLKLDAPAAADEPTPIADGITRETTATLASPAYVPPVQQGTGGSPLLPTLIPPHGLETDRG